jgi:hypothetical protein
VAYPPRVLRYLCGTSTHRLFFYKIGETRRNQATLINRSCLLFHILKFSKIHKNQKNAKNRGNSKIFGEKIIPNFKYLHR